MSDVTRILTAVGQGDCKAAEALLPVVYQELRQLAARRLADEQPGQTLQATALVHEAWLRMVDVDYVQHWNSRRHFFGAAAEAMRRILVDNARRRDRQKRGADWQRVSIEQDDVADSVNEDLLESLDEALQKFEQIDATAFELVKLRYFAGLSLRDAGRLHEIPPRTADRLWAYAKAWLLREIQRDSADSE
ncbi:MAG: sigma-70 family RNA polymerase sigma factor [Rhodopirellula sp.]|nr:sigma-70 family RNA polymerase sigma factor [Rhodopirellula sp.]